MAHGRGSKQCTKWSRLCKFLNCSRRSDEEIWTLKSHSLISQRDIASWGPPSTRHRLLCQQCLRKILNRSSSEDNNIFVCVGSFTKESTDFPLILYIQFWCSTSAAETGKHHSIGFLQHNIPSSSSGRNFRLSVKQTAPLPRDAPGPQLQISTRIPLIRRWAWVTDWLFLNRKFWFPGRSQGEYGMQLLWNGARGVHGARWTLCWMSTLPDQRCLTVPNAIDSSDQRWWFCIYWC